MKRFSFVALGLLVIGCGVAAWAQPPGSPGRGGQGRGGPERGGPEHGGRGADGPRGERHGPADGHPQGSHPVMEALDANHDHVISAEEIQAAAVALLKLDKNGDGELSEDEFRPVGPPPPPPPPRDGEARGGRGARDAGPRHQGDERGRGERAHGERPHGADADRPGRGGPPDRGVGPAHDGPEGHHAGGPGPEGHRAGGPGAGGPPNPERFVEHALQFDANGDGMLDKDELLKFAEEMGQRAGGPSGGPDRGRGERGPGGPRDGDRPPTEDQQRPERPAFES